MSIAMILSILLSAASPSIVLEIPEARDFDGFYALAANTKADIRVETGFATEEVRLWAAMVDGNGQVDIDQLGVQHRFPLNGGVEGSIRIALSKAEAKTMWLIFAEATDSRGRQHISTPMLVNVMAEGEYPRIYPSVYPTKGILDSR